MRVVVDPGYRRTERQEGERRTDARAGTRYLFIEQVSRPFSPRTT